MKWDLLFLSEDRLGAVGHPSRRAGRGSAAGGLERGGGKTFPFLSSPIGDYRKPLGEEMIGPTYNI
jgi:hypothetical protein